MPEKDRRANPRVPANVNVKVRTASGQLQTTERIRNISLGGVFIEMEEPLSFGEEISLEFTLSDGRRVIRCRGFVTWSTKTSPEKASGAEGIGVRLTEIGISDMRALSEYVEANLKNEENAAG